MTCQQLQQQQHKQWVRRADSYGVVPHDLAAIIATAQQQQQQSTTAAATAVSDDCTATTSATAADTQTSSSSITTSSSEQLDDDWSTRSEDQWQYQQHVAITMDSDSSISSSSISSSSSSDTAHTVAVQPREDTLEGEDDIEVKLEVLKLDDVGDDDSDDVALKKKRSNTGTQTGSQTGFETEPLTEISDTDADSDSESSSSSNSSNSNGSNRKKSSSNIPSSLGPKLLEAVMDKFKYRHPRVIVIGDVHGCRAELIDLIKLAEYRPGDLLLFLGDLLAKGPDSVGVVKLARELGGISVRGNHEFEVRTELSLLTHYGALLPHLRVI
jgi:Calcineurin-like phosphoesterase